MATNEELEIYRQCSEASRYWNEQQWKMAQIGVFVTVGILGFGQSGLCPDWLVLMVGGLTLILLGINMHKNGKDLLNACSVLERYANLVGAPEPLPISRWWSSAAVWWRLIFMFGGFSCVLYGILSCFGIVS